MSIIDLAKKTIEKTEENQELKEFSNHSKELLAKEEEERAKRILSFFWQEEQASGMVALIPWISIFLQIVILFILIAKK